LDIHILNRSILCRDLFGSTWFVLAFGSSGDYRSHLHCDLL